MATTKAEILKRKGVAHQQALVQALTSKTTKPVYLQIPGGANILEELDQPTLEYACYNWLRKVTDFTKVKISLAKDPAKYRLQEYKFVDFDADQPHPEWVTHTDGKRYLARLLAEALKSKKLVTVEARKDGIFYTVDSENKFGPSRPATKADVDEMLSELETDEEPLFQLGEPIWNEDWQPFVEFMPVSKGRYAQR